MRSSSSHSPVHPFSGSPVQRQTAATHDSAARDRHRAAARDGWLLQVLPRRAHGGLVVHSLRQVRGDRRRQRAARSVRVPARQARPADLDDSRLRARDVDRLAALGVPPFTSTTRGPSCRIRSPARSMSSSERIGISARTSASGMFGVTICARGRSSDFNAATAVVSSRRSPPSRS